MAPPLRVLRLILLALALGVLIFACIVTGLRSGATGPGNPELGGMLLLLAVGVGVMELPVYLVIRRTLVARARERKDEWLPVVKDGRVPPPLQSLAILGAALAEGVGLLAIIALLLGGPWYALVVPALVIVLILAQMPSRERLERTLRGV